MSALPSITRMASAAVSAARSAAATVAASGWEDRLA
jgi:hypothetical protein